MTVVGSVFRAKREAALFEWIIPDYLSLEAKIFTSLDSPEFSFSGCTWNIQLSPHITGRGLHLILKGPAPPPVKTVSFTFGIKTSDGTLEVKQPASCMKLQRGILKLQLFVEEMHLPRDDLKLRQSDLLPSGNLTVICLLVEGEPPCPAEAVPLPVDCSGLEKLSSRFGELLTSKKKCDVILKVRDKEIEAHRIVLMAQSSVFAAMFEHDTSEAETGTVNVPDCNPDAFYDFLRYLYTGKFESVTPGNAHLLYVIADKYAVEELVSFCVAYMARNLSIENVCDVVSVADQYGETKVMASAQNFFNQNLKRIFSSAEWMKLLSSNCRLANRLLQEMVNDRK